MTETGGPEAAPGGAPPGLRPLRVLVVDDDPDMRRYIRISLARLWRGPATIVECGDGAAALLRAEHERFDAVVTDVRMPVLDGHSLSDALAQSPAHANVPLLFVSGDPAALLRARELAAAHPGRAVLEKPFNAARLVRALEELLAGR